MRLQFEAKTAELEKRGKITILKAHMNTGPKIGDPLRMTTKDRLILVFGEPDIDIEDVAMGKSCYNKRLGYL